MATDEKLPRITPSRETIKFEFFLTAEYWDKPPHVEFHIDETLKYKNDLSLGINHVTFDHTFEFDGNSHILKLARSNKTDDQVKLVDGVVEADQKMIIEKIVVDGVDIRNIMLSKSITKPIYPEPWATKQKLLGHKLETMLYGNTHFGHNAVWYLEFTNPFYKYIMAWMGGGKE